MHAFRRITVITLLIGALMCLPGVVDAQIPNTISYQGILTNAAVPPVIVPDGNYNLIFNLYAVSAGGSAFWTETRSNVPVVEGRFYAELGSVTPLTGVSFGAPYFLGITVNSGAELPRIALTASAYSLNARRVATVDSATGGTITGNINLQASPATVGSILKGGVLFIHGLDNDNTFIGLDAGNLTMSGDYNSGNGAHTLQNNTNGNYNTASGYAALRENSGDYNTACGGFALLGNTTGNYNTASGYAALQHNRGDYNTACGGFALLSNITGERNTAVGHGADVVSTALTNATAIGYYAKVNASNKIRLGNSAVTVIEGQVAFTHASDRNQKENFRPVDGEETLRRIRGLSLTSWNYIGHDPKHFRHYGPTAQEFFAAFGHDGVGISGDSTTINSGDMAGIMMIAIQTLVKENEVTRAENAELKAQLVELKNAVVELRDRDGAASAAK